MTKFSLGEQIAACMEMFRRPPKFEFTLQLAFGPRLVEAPVTEINSREQSRITNRARLVARYKAAMGDEILMTPEIGTRLGICKPFYTLRELEAKGLVRRVGTAPTKGTNRTILWKWINEV